MALSVLCRVMSMSFRSLLFSLGFLAFNVIPSLIVLRESLIQSVPANLIRAIIKVESDWNAQAIRQEPTINDSSYGLMQILGRTAQDLGYIGTSEGLLNPSVNIKLGTRYLKKQLDRYENDIDAAISAYNAGTAFIRSDGSFANQEYVNRVRRWL